MFVRSGSVVDRERESERERARRQDCEWKKAKVTAVSAAVTVQCGGNGLAVDQG